MRQAFLASVFLVSPVFAQINGDLAKPFHDHKVVRVTVEDQAQLDAVLKEADQLWSHRVGIGPVEVIVDTQSFDALRDMGFAPVTLVEDLQGMVDKERAEIDGRSILLDLEWFENYHPYDEVIAYNNGLAADFPDLASVSVIGESIQGRDIIAIEITGPGDRSDRPTVFFNGGQHAREWIGPAATTYFADRLLNLYADDGRVRGLLDKVVVKIVPIVNPDGYSYSWTNNRFWRKNRRDNGNGTRGVDLNRNWDINFGGQGASNDPDSDIYHGPFAFSEPETAAIRDYIFTDPNMVAHVDFHSFSQLILYPWGYTETLVPEPDYSFFVSFSQFLSDTILSVHGEFYTPQRGIDLYPASGICSDWTYSVGLKGWTIELRPNSSNPGFELPPGEIIPTGEENFEAILAIMDRFKDPIRLSFPDGEIDTAFDLEATTVRVQAEGLIDQIDGLSLEVRPDVSTGFVSIPMTDLGDGLYEADVPALSCGRSFEYYVAGLTTGGGDLRLPEDGDLDVGVISEVVTHEDDAETDLGWTVGDSGDTATTGIWNRMNPQATEAQPEDDNSPNGVNCWVTDGQAGGGLGDRDVDGGGTTLTSPAFDATVTGDWLSAESHISYARWYSNDRGAEPDSDHMPIHISNDGGNTWVELEDVTENRNAWVTKSFAIADPSDNMRLRIVARDDSPGSIVEAAIDDIRVLIRGCQYHPSDLNRDGTTDASDFFAFLDLFAASDPGADLDLNGTIDAGDFFAFLDLFADA